MSSAPSKKAKTDTNESAPGTESGPQTAASRQRGSRAGVKNRPTLDWDGLWHKPSLRPLSVMLAKAEKTTSTALTDITEVKPTDITEVKPTAMTETKNMDIYTDTYGNRDPI